MSLIKRKDVPKLSPEQAADELVFMEFEKALKSAKRKAVAAQKAQNHIFELLEDMRIDAEKIPTKAENARLQKCYFVCCARANKGGELNVFK